MSQDLITSIQGLRCGQSASIRLDWNVRIDVEAPVRRGQFLKQDRTAPKYDDWWCFPVCGYTGKLDDNSRALYDCVREDASIKKIVLTGDTPVEADGTNVEVWPRNSRRGQYYLMRSKQIFIKHSVARNIGFAIDPELHNVVNLWHGVPLKRIGYVGKDLVHRREKTVAQNSMLSAVICSSGIDRLAMAAAFYPLTYDDIWLTGLPRHDWIVTREDDLTTDMRASLASIDADVAGRRLVLFTPTFRNEERTFEFLDATERSGLGDVLRRHNAVIGLRPHMAEKEALLGYFPSDTLDVSSERYPSVEMLYRRADVLVTDFSSSYIDFMLTGKPILQFVKDAVRYENEERGLFYDRDLVLPAPVAENGLDLAKYLDMALRGESVVAPSAYRFARQALVPLDDGRSAERVKQRVLELYSEKPGGDEGSSESLGNRRDAEGAIRSRTKQPEIVFVANERDVDALWFRPFEVMNANRAHRFASRVVSDTDVNEISLHPQDVVVLCSGIGNDELADVVVAHQRAGGCVVADIYDVMFDVVFLANSIYFAHQEDRQVELLEQSAAVMRAISESDLCLCATPGIMDKLDRSGVKVAFVPNVAVPRDLGPAVFRDRAEGANPVRVGYFSFLLDHRGSFELCEPGLRGALRRYPDLEVHLVGGREGSLGEDWEGRVVAHAPNSNELTSSVMAAMDVNLVPVVETELGDPKSGLSVLEAARLGVPSIATPTWYCQSLIEDRASGLFATSEDSWSAAISDLVESADMRRQLGETAREQIARRYGPDEVTEMFLSAIGLG